MEHEDLAGTHFPLLWEALSSEDSGSVSCTLLPELCSPEGSSSWLSSHSTSTLLQRPFFSEDDFLVRSHDDDRLLGPVADHKKVDFTTPGSPCSPLLFNFLQTPGFEQADFAVYGALHLQMQQQRAGSECKRSSKTSHDPVDTMAFRDAGDKDIDIEAASEVKEEPLGRNATEHGDDCQPPAKRRCSRTPDPVSPLLQEAATVSISEAAAALGHALNTDGKPRAKRGSATDPQSVYARHRRERINERLRTLQALVPNGGKVDIVTMLEEAINYVKFLQLQVKLLNSDEHWMYAPTTYNGMNISLGMHLGIQSFISQAQA